MKLGIFSKVFVRPTAEESLEAARSHGFSCLQFNLATAGLAPMPDHIDSELCRAIGKAMSRRGLEMAAVSGTFNMGHPDQVHRRAGLNRLGLLASACPLLGTSVITLCTGTRDPEDMWRWHADNGSREAWRDMAGTMAQALEMAEKAGVTLAIEPEVSNIVDSAAKARRLLDEMGSGHLKIVMDGANLFHAGELPRMTEILNGAFAALGGDIVLAHAKDLSRDGEAGHEAAGFGLLDYDLYLKLLHESNFGGPLVLHGLDESQVPQCVGFLRDKLSRLTSAKG